jgi:hypothetical protein
MWHDLQVTNPETIIRDTPHGILILEWKQFGPWRFLTGQLL